MTIRSMLVATDFSVQERLALQGAWQLACAHRASVKLMYMPPAGQPVPGPAAARLADAARQLEESPGLRVQTVPLRKERHFDELVAQARGVDLVVLPHRRERSTAALFRGEPVLRLLRRAARPVLVVRQGGDGHYGRILVAVDFSPSSEALVQFAADLEPRAELEIFHALGTRDEARLRSAEAPEHAVRAFRRRMARRAREQLLTLSDSFTARRNRVLTMMGRGDPGQQAIVQQERSGADLLVVGKRRSSAWADFFSGSVAHRVLSWGGSDVLVVPDAYLQASAPMAAHRLAGGTATALPMPAAARSSP